MEAKERLDLINRERLETGSINELSYLIYELTRLWNPQVAVEIGVNDGCSTLCILHGLHNKARLFSYDIKPIKETTIAKVKEDKLDHKWYVRDVGSDKGFEQWDKNLKIDFLFIDGDHTPPQMERDYFNWSQYVRQGGLILFHDALPDTERLTNLHKYGDTIRKYSVNKLCKEINAFILPQSQGLGLYIKQ